MFSVTQMCAYRNPGMKSSKSFFFFQKCKSVSKSKSFGYPAETYEVRYLSFGSIFCLFFLVYPHN